jgi:excisionase family DNA binding protein
MESALSTGTLGKLLGVKPDTLSDWASAGRVPAFKIGADYRFDPQLIADHIESQQNSYRRALHEYADTLCKSTEMEKL